MPTLPTLQLIVIQRQSQGLPPPWAACNVHVIIWRLQGCSGESKSSCSSQRWTAQEQLDAAHQPPVALLQSQVCCWCCTLWSQAGTLTVPTPARASQQA